MSFLKIKNVLSYPWFWTYLYQEEVLINECKSCKISNQMFFNVMFSFSKTKKQTSSDINIAK